MTDVSGSGEDVKKYCDIYHQLSLLKDRFGESV